MATYLNFLAITKRGELRRAYWVTGQEEILREQVVNILRKISIGCKFSHRICLSVQSDGEAAVWSALDSWGLDPDSRSFIVVNGAEKLSQPARLAEWLADRKGPRHLGVFVADEENWPLSREPEVRSRILKSGMYVHCGRASEKAALETTQDWLRCDPQFARKVLNLNGWDLSQVRSVASKAQLLGQLNNLSVVTVLSQQQLTNKYVEELTSCERAAALQSALVMEPYERSPAIGLLDHNLEILSRINGMLRNSRSQRETASRLGLHHLVVERLYPFARLYDREAVSKRAVALAKADRALAQGAEIGVMEVLAASW